jgi:hypothetical protein
VGDPCRAFAFFTFVAGSQRAGRPSGRRPAHLSAGIAAGHRRGRLAGANGTWIIQAIGTQSIAVAATSLPQPVPEALAALAMGC